MDTLKTCRICGLPKPLADFHKRTRSLDGHQAHCAACGRAALDAADARAAAARRQASLISEWAGLERFVQTHAWDVVDALSDAAWAGTPLVLAYLAERLCSPCPEPDDEDYGGPSCLLHDLAMVHTNELVARPPAAAPLVAAFEADPAAAVVPPEAE